MVPLADMFNHDVPPAAQTHWLYNDEKKGFEIKACEEIKKGDEVYFSYGDERTNTSLFPTYGFLTIPNYFDFVTMTFELDGDGKDALF